MKILITGTSQGIGKAISELFLKHNHEVIGIDRQNSTIVHENYTHYTCDIRDYDRLPNIENIEILINNAGTMLPFQRADKVEDFDIERIRRFRQDYMCACDGKSTERIIKTVL